MMEDLTLFLSAEASVPTTIFRTKIWRSFSSFFYQHTLMLSYFGVVPIICILFLDFARFVIVALYSGAPRENLAIGISLF